MRLLERTREAGERVEKATFQVDLAILKMEETLNDVERQVEEAREVIGERHSG
jgi:hypothetical protein